MEFVSRALHSLHALQLLLLPHLKNTIPLHVLHSFLPDSDIVRSQQESSGGSWSLVTTHQADNVCADTCEVGEHWAQLRFERHLCVHKLLINMWGEFNHPSSYQSNP